jgi:hypothetical protein
VLFQSIGFAASAIKRYVITFEFTQMNATTDSSKYFDDF